VPLCFAAFVRRVFLFRPCSIVFIESFCRVQSLSLSGLLLYPIVDQFVVQWPQLARSQKTPQGEQHEQQRQQHHSKQQDSADADPASAAHAVPSSGWRFAKYIGRLC